MTRGGFYDAEKRGARVLSSEGGTPDYRGERPVTALRHTLNIFTKFCGVSKEKDRELLGSILMLFREKNLKPGQKPAFSRKKIQKEIRKVDTYVQCGLLDLVDRGWLEETRDRRGFVVYTPTKEGWEALDRWMARQGHT